MTSRQALLGVTLVCLAGVPALAEPALPAVDGVDWRKFQTRSAQLCKTIKELKMDLPSEVEREIAGLAAAADREESLKSIQRSLDALCLVGITINPESRVKVARGPADAVLGKDRDVFFLIKVHNEGGVTSALSVSGPQIVSRNEPAEGRWLEAAVLPAVVHGENLTGQRLEYFILRLRAREKGKRESTLRFDVGQGTEDLGFRAEVPILFVVQ